MRSLPELDGASLTAARAAFCALVSLRGTTRRRLEEAAGQALAESVVATFPLPPFANSAMDGYALCAADVASASPERPVALQIAGTAAAGHVIGGNLRARQAARIMTGGRLPDGADAVLPNEQATESGGRLIVSAPVEAGRHVRREGEDMAAGMVALRRGVTLDARALALLGALGKEYVSVATRPRVAVLTTGDELRRPGERRDLGDVYNANLFALCAQVQEAGGDPIALPPVADNADAIAAALERASGADAIVTSGGMAAGQCDFLAVAARRMGRFADGSLRLRPARHVGLGDIHGTPLFALPGNPSASLIAFELLVWPALRRMGGHAHSRRPLVRASLGAPIESVVGVAQALWMRLESTAGGYCAVEAGHQGAGMLGTAARADGLLVVPEAVCDYAAGDSVAVQLLSGALGEERG